jgi:hypothetical protein
VDARVGEAIEEDSAMRPRRFRIRRLLWVTGAIAIVLAAVHGNIATQKWIHELRIEREVRRAAAETNRPDWALFFRAEAEIAPRGAAAERPDTIVLGCQILTVLGPGWAMILFPLRVLRRAVRAAIRRRTRAAPALSAE